MRILRNLAALAVVLVIGTACQSDVTGPTIPAKRSNAMATAGAPAAAPAKPQAESAQNSTAKPKSRYAMAAN